MEDESGYEVIEELVVQIDDEFRDTAPMAVPAGMRAETHSEWPPEPPLPADDVELAVGTITEGEPPPRRHKGIFEAVRGPTTLSDDEGD